MKKSRVFAVLAAMCFVSFGCGKERSKPVQENFVKIPAASIAGTEKWIPKSSVFVRGRKLEIAAFYMSDHEVTRGEYKAVMGIDPSEADAYNKDGKKLTGDATKNNPVTDVSWYEALVYCNTRSIKENLSPCYKIDGETDPGKWGEVPKKCYDEKWNAATCDFTADGYRLPTEAEWEWAARSGESYDYAGSDDISEVAWYSYNTGETGTRDVKTKKANGYGLYDMSGNVAEWCWDLCTHENISSYTPISGDTLISGDSQWNYRASRGGSYLEDSIKYLNIYYDRESGFPESQDSYTGFRLVRSSIK